MIDFPDWFVPLMFAAVALCTAVPVWPARDLRAGRHGIWNGWPR